MRCASVRQTGLRDSVWGSEGDAIGDAVWAQASRQIVKPVLPPPTPHPHSFLLWQHHPLILLT